MTRYAVIGGGIIGTTIALELAKRNAGEVTVLEKESSLGCHASGRNSGVIHSGINQKPGSLKARMCVEGSRRLREYCRKRGVPMVECGTLVVARSENELAMLEHLLNMGKECGVPELILIGLEKLKSKEPATCGIAALFSPTGTVVDSLALLEALACDARELGVRYLFFHKVLQVEVKNGTLVTSKGGVKATHIINCAGLEADRIAHLMGVACGFRVIPFRGEYMEVRGCNVRTMIYPVPNLQFPFLGIHLTRETNGRVLAGPSAVLSFGREAYEKEWIWNEMIEIFFSRQFRKLVTNPVFLGLAFKNALTSFSRNAFLKEVRSLVPSVKGEQLVPYRSGIRAQLVDSAGHLVDDMLVEYRNTSTHVLNAVSPGMTSSLAFAEHVVNRILK